MPDNLPHLKKIRLELHSPDLKSIFTSLPSSLPHLKELYIEGPYLTSLEGFPTYLPHVEKLTIRGKFQDPNNDLNWSDPPCRTNIVSFRGLPDELPSLIRFEFSSNTMTSPLGIAQDLPQLQEMFLRCPQLHSLDGLPPSLPMVRNLTISSQNLQFLRGYPHHAPRVTSLNVTNSSLTRVDINLSQYPLMKFLNLRGNPLKSLHGVPLPFLSTEYFFDSMIHLRKDKTLNKYLVCANLFQFSPRGMELILDWLNSPIKEGLQAIKDMAKAGLDYKHLKHAMYESLWPTEESCQALFAFYEKSPLTLAQQYVHSRRYGLHDGPPTEPLTEDEYERLLYEVEDPEIAYLRSHLSEEDKVIRYLEESTLRWRKDVREKLLQQGVAIEDLEIRSFNYYNDD